MKYLPISALILTLLLPVAVFAQQTVCLQCHSSQTGRGGKPVKPWQGSIHAENGISCNDCHGGDPKDAANAMSPSRGFLGVPKETAIPDFCGHCHVGIREDYLQSAHGKALGHGGPTCVTCHGSHDITRVTLELINEKSCSRCHTYDRAAQIKSAMQDTEKLLSDLSTRLTDLKGEGVATEVMDKSLFAARNQYHRLFHTVDVDKVKQESGQIRSELDKLKKSVQAINDQRYKRKIAGALIVGGALLAALLTHLLRKTFD